MIHIFDEDIVFELSRRLLLLVEDCIDQEVARLRRQPNNDDLQATDLAPVPGELGSTLQAIHNGLLQTSKWMLSECSQQSSIGQTAVEQAVSCSNREVSSSSSLRTHPAQQGRALTSLLAVQQLYLRASEELLQCNRAELVRGTNVCMHLDAPLRRKKPRLLASKEAIDKQTKDDTKSHQTSSDYADTVGRFVDGNLNDVIGQEAAKYNLRRNLIYPLQLPYLFTGIRQPCQCCILYGPPGTGKTLLATKTAAEASIPLMELSPASLLSKWTGESEQNLRQAFARAQSAAPSMLLLDEVDCLARSRTADDDHSARRLLSQLLIQLQELASSSSTVRVIATTNRLEDCDPALLRRFPLRIQVGLPDIHARDVFIQTTLERASVSVCMSADDVMRVSEQTVGYSTSDLSALCKEAALAAVWEKVDSINEGEETPAALRAELLRGVSYNDFKAAMEVIKPSCSIIKDTDCNRSKHSAGKRDRLLDSKNQFLTEF